MNFREKPDSFWRDKLTAEQYRVLRQGGTECAFTGQNYTIKEKGTFHCVGCESSLFRTSAKFESGTGWPSFYESVDKSKLDLIEDTSLGMTRVEVKCASCDGHLGHVFPDGPPPTGNRFCINAVALKLIADNDEA